MESSEQVEPRTAQQTRVVATSANRGRGLLEVARSVLEDLDVDVVLSRVLDSARDLTGARYAAVGVLDASRTKLERFVTAGIDDATRTEIGPLPTGRGVLGELIVHPVPLRLSDVGAHPRSYGFPIGHPPMSSFLGVPVCVGGEPWGNLYLTDKEGGEEFTGEDEEALAVLAEFAGVAIDHARRFTTVDSRRNELQRTVTALQTTMEIARTLAGHTELASILELVAKRGRALISARALAIELEDEGDLLVAAAAGELPTTLIGERLAIEHSLASTAFRTGQPQRMEDEVSRSRFTQYGLGKLGVEASAGLIVPLLLRGKPYGALVALDRLEDGPFFTIEDERLLAAFATSAAVAVATARSMALERREQRLAAADEERGRWARELHDETLQGLGALRVGLDVAQQTGTREALTDAVGMALEVLDDEIANLRALITELRPAALDAFGLGPALDALANRAGSQGLPVHLEVDLPHDEAAHGGRLAPELETAVYRIVQEALTNARKHGQAERAAVAVKVVGETVRLVIRDNGDGFDPRMPTEGFGVLGMRERAELLDGTMRIASSPGEGVVVSATLPLRRRRTERTARPPVRGSAVDAAS